MKKLFEEPEINKNIRDLGYNFIEKYGLLPNDALILATCKFYGVNYLVSFDSDFREVCKGEGITLIDEKT
ncbi:MAG: PIN domain-containing protein [Candidatus Odinarchaeia archaeon]